MCTLLVTGSNYRQDLARTANRTNPESPKQQGKYGLSTPFLSAKQINNLLFLLVYSNKLEEVRNLLNSPLLAAPDNHSMQKQFIFDEVNHSTLSVFQYEVQVT